MKSLYWLKFDYKFYEDTMEKQEQITTQYLDFFLKTWLKYRRRELQYMFKMIPRRFCFWFRPEYNSFSYGFHKQPASFNYPFSGHHLVLID